MQHLAIRGSWPEQPRLCSPQEKVSLNALEFFHPQVEDTQWAAFGGRSAVVQVEHRQMRSHSTQAAFLSLGDRLTMNLRLLLSLAVYVFEINMLYVNCFMWVFYLTRLTHVGNQCTVNLLYKFFYQDIWNYYSLFLQISIWHVLSFPSTVPILVNSASMNWIFALPKFMCWSPKPHCDCIWRWSLHGGNQSWG